ncbi:MAG: hypothetical protein CL607_00410 [Anaerolineaceae bacterium]|nr:hypothetical protein [Anaerolineaceae bacterium]
MFNIQLFGGIELEPPNGAIAERTFRRKSRIILAYIALTQKPVSRDALSRLFFHDSNDPAGNLRWHISRIRRSLSPDILHLKGDTVALNLDKASVDALQFAAALKQKQQGNVQFLEETLSLYRGELLAGFSLSQLDDFGFWLLGQRAQYSQMYESYTMTLIKQLAKNSAYDKALTWAQTLVDHNSTLEDAHYWLIWLYARQRQATVALKQYELYEQLIQSEFGNQPSEKMTQLKQHILNDNLPDLWQKTVIEVPSALHPDRFFMGRTRELEQLQQGYRYLSRGTGQFHLLEGDAGMGKSALIGQFLKQTDINALAFYGTFYESTASSALAPWIKILRDCLSWTQENKPSLIPQSLHEKLIHIAPDFFNIQSDESKTKESEPLDAALLLNALADVFSLVAKHNKLMIVLENIHFADETSVQLLSLLLNRLSTTPMLLLASQRIQESENNRFLKRALDEWDSHSAYKRMTLKNLDVSAINEMIQKQWPQLSQQVDLTTKLVDHTSGITLHIIEILHELEQIGAIPPELPAPPSLSKIIVQRLERMPANHLNALETLAIVNYPSTLAEIIASTGEADEQIINSMDNALQSRLVMTMQDNGHLRYDFAHSLIQQIVQDQTPDHRKQSINRRVVELLEKRALILADSDRSELINRLVYHAQQADDVSRLLRWTPIAADAAKNAFAYRQALKLYERLDRSLQNTPTITYDEYAQILLDMVSILDYLGDWNYQDTLLSRICRWEEMLLLEDESILVAYHVAYGTTKFRLGDYGIAKEYLEHAVANAKRLKKDNILSKAYNSLGNIAYSQAEWGIATQYYHKSIDIRQQLGDEVAIGIAYNNLGSVAFRQGQYKQAIEYFQKNLTIREAHGDQHGIATSNNNIGAVYMIQGQWDAASECYEKSLNIRRELGDQHGIASTLSNLAQLSVNLNDPLRAIELYEESLAIRTAINDQASIAHSLMAIGSLYSQLEDYSKAEPYLLRSLEINHALDIKTQHAETLLELSYIKAMRNRSMPDETFYQALEQSQAISSNLNIDIAIKRFSQILIHIGKPLLAAKYVGFLYEQIEIAKRDRLKPIIDILRANLTEDELFGSMHDGSQQSYEEIINEIMQHHP